MKGHIRKRGKHTYQVIISAGRDGKTGKYSQHTVTVHGSKADAENRLLELQHQRLTGSYAEPNHITLGQFLDRWYQEYVLANCNPRTALGYESIIRCHLKPSMGSLELAKIKPEHILRYQTEKLNGDPSHKVPPLSATSVRGHHMVLHGALRSAVRWELINHNPADAVDAPRPRRTQMQTWNEDEIHSFLEAAKPTPFYNEFYTVLHTGLRLSELLAPRWRDVDLERGYMEITRGLYQIKRKLMFGPLKNRSSYRTIELTPSNVAVLRQQRAKQEFYRMMVEKPLTEDDLIFSHVDGSPLRPGSVSRAWAILVQQTELRKIRFHDARHTHASLLLKAGVNIKMIQERLGHSSISTTLDIYSHTSPAMHRDAAMRFDEMLKTRL